MIKNVINCKENEFVPGRTFRATVKAAHREGVLVDMPGGRGSGVISPRCWGASHEREKALAAIHAGDELDVTVRLYDTRNCMLSLVLAGCERVVPSPKKDNRSARSVAWQRHGKVCSRKPDFVPIAAGTAFLWDASNLLGDIGSENAVRTFMAIARSMSEHGYKHLFFIEQRCLTWALHNQRSARDAAELEAFARRNDVVVVGDCGNGTGEADCAILQMAEAMPNSVCVTRDRYDDYANAYPGIVGTSRIRSFSVARVGGRTMVLVNGIAHAIVVDGDSGQREVVPGAPFAPASESSAAASAVAPVEVHVDAPSAESDIFGRRGGLFEIAGERVRRGDVRGAVRIYAKVARRDPSAYRALAEMYREGCGGCADIKKAARYERLARAAEKSRRECSLRERRLRAESIRGGECDFGHFSTKRRKALDLAVFASRHEMVCEYRKLRRARRGWGRAYGRAA